MVSISLTATNAQGNPLLSLLGVLVPSPAHGEGGGRLFLCGETLLSDQEVPRGQGKAPEVKI
jgi:hypothetical protein